MNGVLEQVERADRMHNHIAMRSGGFAGQQLANSYRRWRFACLIGLVGGVVVLVGRESPAASPTGQNPILANRPGEDASDWQSAFAARQSLWSLQPVYAPSVPGRNDSDWSVHPVDRFIQAKLAEQGLRPAPPASRSAWLRRVQFAITGLPPTPADVAAFLQDASPVAKARVVDRLLASPSFGERWARHWMDLVRFAESYGHEQDYEIPHAWQYRDYLIRALNADVPYNQFVREHIAGDLMQDPRRNPTDGFNESVIGTGFWYLHQATHAPVDPQQDEADRIDNQIDVFAKTFLGLTVACARCHDHKFDAISAEDYYSLTAFLRGSRQQIAFLDPAGKLARRVNELQQRHAEATATLRSALQRLLDQDGLQVAPYMVTAYGLLHDPARKSDARPDGPPPSPEALDKAISQVAADRRLDPAVLQRWVLALNSPVADRPDHPLRPWLDTLAENQEPRGAAQPAGAELGGDDIPFSVFRFGDWFPSGQAFEAQHQTVGTWRIAGDAIEFLPPGMIHSGRLADGLQGVLRSPTFKITHNNMHLRVAGTGGQVRLIISRYGLREFNPLLFGETLFDVQTEGHFQWHSLTSDIRRYQGHNAYFELIDEGSGYLAVDRIVFSNSDQPPSTDPEVAPDTASNRLLDVGNHLENAVAQALASWLGSGSDARSEFLLSWMSRRGLLDWGMATSTLVPLTQQWQSATADLPSPMRVLAMTDGSREETRLFTRGDPKQPAETVTQRFLECLVGCAPLPIAHGSGRLELAEIVTSDSNPLLHRVLVNRVWAHLFGRGLVPTVDNFGLNGLPPTHPELLDHLVVEFRNGGGSLKRLIRELCLTRSFGMASVNDDRMAESRDPQNQWLHRQRIRRLEGEALRDALLAASGELDLTQFGPSVPTYLSPFMGDPFWLTGRGIQSGALNGENRRSIYLETRRNFISPLMLTFDLALPDTTVGQRNATNVPGQALALMNDPFVTQQAMALAGRLLALEPGDSRTRIEQLFVRALARRPGADEMDQMLRFLATQASAYGQSASAAERDQQLWGDLCHVLFMTKEFIYVP